MEIPLCPFALPARCSEESVQGSETRVVDLLSLQRTCINEYTVEYTSVLDEVKE